MSSIQRSPCLEFFYILQHDYSRSYQSSPSACYPCKTSYILWLAAFCLAEMFTVWREPGKPDRMPITCLHWVYLPYIFTIMFRIRMVCFMHCNSLRIMVNCYIHTKAGSFFYSGGSSAPTSEIINY